MSNQVMLQQQNQKEEVEKGKQKEEFETYYLEFAIVHGMFYVPPCFILIIKIHEQIFTENQ